MRGPRCVGTDTEMNKMNRREFLAAGPLIAGSVAGCAVPDARDGPGRSRGGRTSRMVTGHPGGADPKKAQYLLRHGCRHVVASPPGNGPDGCWTVEGIKAKQRAVRAVGLEIGEMYVGIPLHTLVPGKRRDAAIRSLIGNIRAAGKAGIPCLHYNLRMRVWRARTGRTPGRGGATYSTWKLTEAERQRGKRGIEGVSRDDLWKGVTYLLERIAPAAARAGVKLACHPDDPPVPEEGLMGHNQVLNSVADMKRFVSIAANDYHGVSFCLGSVAEMLRDPGKEIHDVIEWFASRGKIHNVHLRNIFGGRDNFQEVFPDEGVVDMARAVGILHRHGYRGLIMPDHVPHHEDDSGGQQSVAHCFGYITGLIQAAEAGVIQ